MEKNIKNNQEKEEYVLIDLLKFIFAIMIVGIHTQTMNDSNSNVQWYILHIIYRAAVPFFFLSSGFLFGKKYLKNKENLKLNTTRQIKRLLIPFLFWMLVSLPYIIITTTGQNVIVIILKILRKAIFYPWGALWFILALILAIAIEYFFLKKKKLRIALIISAFLYIIGLLGNSYYFVLDGIFKKAMDIYITICVSTRNGIFVAFPIFTVGVYLATKEKMIEKLSKSKISICFIIILLAQIIEVTFIRNCNYADDHSLFFTTIPIVTILLIICIKSKNIKFKKINNKLLRNLSTGIYFLHMPIIRYSSFFNLNLGNWQMFFMTTILALLICLIANKINNKYINYIIK